MENASDNMSQIAIIIANISNFLSSFCGWQAGKVETCSAYFLAKLNIQWRYASLTETLKDIGIKQYISWWTIIISVLLNSWSVISLCYSYFAISCTISIQKFPARKFNFENFDMVVALDATAILFNISEFFKNNEICCFFCIWVPAEHFFICLVSAV